MADPAGISKVHYVCNKHVEAVREDEVSLTGSARRGVSKTTPICIDQMRVSVVC